ncbi:MAG: response regulator, partial [Christensenellaceae bacterium]|nr:response regulator [Christensenellaceae bacterium]
FSSFTQADSSISKQYGGTGLGLAISKSLCEKTGGDIKLSSEVGKGSLFTATFVMEIPLESEIPNEVADDSELNDVIPDLYGKRILLAEDIAVNREIVRELLSITNAEIDEAVDGKLAYEMFISDEKGYDIVLMDVQMPVMDGLTATRKIRESGISNAKTIPIIAMTANVFIDDVDKCIKAGMNAHLGKPIDFKQVFNTLKKFLL